MHRAIKVGVLSATSLLVMMVLARLADAPDIVLPTAEPVTAEAGMAPASEPAARPAEQPPAPVAQTPAKLTEPDKPAKMDVEPFRPLGRPNIVKHTNHEPVGPVPAGAVGGPVPESLKPESERYKPWR